MPDLQHLLDQIDRLDQEATKGPWNATPKTYGIARVKNLEGLTIATNTSESITEFIALARTALPQLAKAVRAVMELLDNEEEQHARTHGQVFNGDQTAPARISVNVVRLAIQNAMEADDA